MDRNVGREDRVVRIVVAIGLAALIYFTDLGDTAEIVAAVIAAYLIISGFLSLCAVYKMLGVNTAVQEQPYSSTDDRAGL